jgi:hypothetical protein
MTSSCCECCLLNDARDIRGIPAVLGDVAISCELGRKREGFDDSRLDTLFLVMPISWRGTLAQYVGRLHRDHDGKREVIVYDYVDTNVPMLARMAVKRAKGYKALGYTFDTED